jgi:muramoyltetrapeptide carboxypeptidase
MLKPRRLRSGDRVAIVAPATPFPQDEFHQGVVELQRLGFEPVFDPDVFARLGYLSGEDRLRARVFLDAWTDPTISAVIAVRGGYGSVHLLPYLDRAVLRQTPKSFVGYSDLTSVLTYLTVGCGMVAFHGPMLDRRLSHGTAAYDRDTFLRALTLAEPLGELTAPGLEIFRKGEASGLLFGGTLTQLCASLGTPYAFAPPKGYVLFLEDVGERPYRLDRMLTQLRLAGILATASAIVFGEFPGCDEPNGEVMGRAVLADLTRDFDGPVIYGFPSGHGAGPLVTLPLGVQARIVAEGSPRLVIEEAGVA